MSHPYCIAFLGADWWGSDARAVAMELRQRGHVLVERNYEDYFPTKWRGSIRVLRRLFKPWMVHEYNRAVLEMLSIDTIDFLLAFKGMLLKPSTLQAFKDRGVKCYCIYPDVSFHDHGRNIWDCLPLYDCVFTTKSFHTTDEAVKSRVRKLILVNHGFDPAVHRPIPCLGSMLKTYGSDVSFVGTWSPKKEKTMRMMVEALPSLNLKIWGTGWERSAPPVIRYWQGRGAYGDEAAAIYSMSKINLGLLSEAGTATVQGDQTTARTWQIPSSGGFMLHEATIELATIFQTDGEVAVFASNQELVEKTVFFLANPAEREIIRQAGRERCQRSGYSYENTVTKILAHHCELENINTG